MQPLSGVKVLDFSTLLPGPMCTLMLADAGADVIKLERPGGDEMRSYEPRFGTDSVNFAMLNRGKKSVTADLKDPKALEKILALVTDTDVIVEQFRPGVMDRLGLGYTTLSKINPKLIYCSITGYGQTGPDAQIAAHDLNYQAQTGMLSLTAERNGAHSVPPTLTADLAGGAYPATINILLGLLQRDQTGHGCHLDISMSDNLFPLMYWGLGNGWASGTWPQPGQDLVTGGSPRYQVYETADQQYLACAPIEAKFWFNFLAIVGAPELQDVLFDIKARDHIAKLIGAKPMTYWLSRFANQDTCVNRIVSLQEASQDPHFLARGVFNRTTSSHTGEKITALPSAVCSGFLSPERDAISPGLGQHTNEILGE